MAQEFAAERWNPNRRPDWRYERVLRMIDRPDGPGRSTRHDDDHVRTLRKFVIRYRNGDSYIRSAMGYENPGLTWAYQIYTETDETSMRNSTIIEARLLAGQKSEEIAGEMCTIPETIDWYERLFFNVRDRLHAHDWILTQALLPAYTNSRVIVPEADSKAVGKREPRQPLSEPFFDCTLKWFAYFGGPLLLDCMLSGHRRGNTLQSGDQDEIVKWCDSHYELRFRQRSVMALQTFQLSKYDVMKLFEVHNQLIAIRQSNANQQQAKSQMTKAIEGMIKSMPWAVGDEGKAKVKGTFLELYDESAVELRDSEMMLVANGKSPADIKDIEKFTLPAPRAMTGKEINDAAAKS